MLGDVLLRARDRVLDRLVGVVAVEDADRRVRVVHVEEAVHLAAPRAGGEEEEELAHVVVARGQHLPLGIRLVERPEDLLEQRRRRDRAAHFGPLRHVAAEEIELVEGLGVLDRSLALLACLAAARALLLGTTGLAGVAGARLPAVGAVRLPLGDDDQLARAEELLVHLPEGDVVGMVGIEKRRAGRRVADLQEMLEVEADAEQREQADRHRAAPPAAGEPEEAALDRLVERAEEPAEAVRRAAHRRADGRVAEEAAVEQHVDGEADHRDREERLHRPGRDDGVQVEEPRDGHEDHPRHEALEDPLRCTLLARRRREGKDDRVQRHDAHEDRDDPERAEDRELLDDRDARHEEREDRQAVGEERDHRRRIDLRVRLDDRLVLVAEPAVLLVVALHRLHGVRVGAGGDEERDDEHERIEAEPPEPAEPEPPDGRQEAAEGRDHDALPAPELHPEDQQDHDDRGAEHARHLRHDLHEVREEDRDAGDVDRRVVVGLALDDLLDLHPHRREVEVLLPEAGDDLRRLVVLGDEEAVDPFGGVDLQLQEIEVVLGLRHARIHERHDLDAGAGGEGGLHLRMGDRQHLLAVDAGDVVQQRERDAVDLLHRLRVVEDRAVLHLDDDQHRVRGAEHAAVLLVEPDVRVVLRVEVEEVREDVHPEPHEEGQADGDDRDDHRDEDAVTQEEEEVGFDRPAGKHVLSVSRPPREGRRGPARCGR